MKRFVFAAALALAPISAAADLEQDALIAPRLGAATNFGQSWFPQYLSGGERLGLDFYRDEMFWKGIEQADGRFVFDNPRTRYPHRIEALDRDLMFIVNNGHPSYDDGWSPSSDEAVQAFANYAVRLVSAYPAITTLEVGNEMNSETFATGPGWSAPLPVRAASYAKLARATVDAVRAVRPDIRILGGAAHSIPIAWFREIFKHGLDDAFDALVIHPYTVPPEQLARQIALLRQMVPQTRDLPLAVTEFGEDDAEAAPDYLIKFYCQMAVSNVESAIWYPLNPRGDEMTALLNKVGTPTPTGEAFRTAAAWFEGRVVQEVRPDPFTYGCLFGSDTLVLWGAPRQVVLSDDVYAYAANGARIEGSRFTLSADVPMILRSERVPVRLAQDSVWLGPHGLIADSYHQFGFPGYGSDPFERLVVQAGREAPLLTRPGQETDGVPWVPYLSSDIDWLARASASWAVPSTQAGPIDILYRYRADAPARVDAAIWVSPSARSEDGVTVTLRLNGQALAKERVRTAKWVTVPNLSLRRGDLVDVALGPNENDAGDYAQFRVQLREAAQ